MIKLAWRGVRHNTGRYVATLVAIMTGVAFFAATGFLGDRIVDSIEGDTRRQFSEVDVAVIPDGEEATGLVLEADKLRLPIELADQIAAMDGVDAVAPVLAGRLAIVDGEDVDDIPGRLWVTDDELNPTDIVEGVAPQSRGEVALDRENADEHGLNVGDTIAIRSIAGETSGTLVGLTEFGKNNAIDQAGTLSLAQDDAFEFLSGGKQEYDELYVRSGADQTAVADAIAGVVPAGFKAQPGDEFLEAKVTELGGFAKTLKKVLQAFAFLSIAVGAFVIYNTFSVIVTQRTKELAVLRAIGATPRQVKRALRWEGLVVGFLGSVLGLLAGVLFVYVIDFVVTTFFGLNVPGSGVVIRANTVLIGLALGTLVTWLSVMVPARKAATTEPIEALRDAAVESSPFSKGRLIFTVVMGGIGLLMIFAGGKLGIVGGGLGLVFIAVIAAGPFLAVLLSRIVKPAMSGLGLEGRLAVDNTGRNPQRTATTANALLIGVFLVTLVTVAGTSMKNFAVEQLAQVESADFLLLSDGGSLDDKLLADISAVEGVELVTPFRRQQVAVNGQPGPISTLDLDVVVPKTDISAETGSFDDLVNGTIVVPVSAGLSVGDSAEVAAARGQTGSFKVVAVTTDGADAGLVGAILTSDDFDALVGEVAPTVAFIDAERGQLDQTADSLEELSDERPDLSVVPGNFIGQLIGQIFDFLINAINGLLGMSVLVAAIGIINTLSLSVFERRRELGLLRVVGMVDKKVERMVRYESILIALLGTLAGLILGVFVSWALLFSIRRINPEATVAFAWTPGRLVLIVVGGFLLGFLAALIPARRSTRLSVLDAISAS